MLSFFRWLFIKCYIYCRGVRFYSTYRNPEVKEFKRAEFKTIEGKEIIFNFYKEIYLDCVYKRGKIIDRKSIAYVISINIDDNLDNSIKEFNNLKIVFSSYLVTDENEEELDKQLLNVYLKFIKNRLSKKKL